MAKQDAPVDPKVQKWLDENAISTGKADINLVVTEGQKETKIPVMKSILAVHSGLIRGLPDTDDVPIIGDHDARTVVQYVTLCYPRLDAPVPTFSLTEITKLTRLAHWLDAPKVLDLLFGQLKKVLDNTSMDYKPGNSERTLKKNYPTTATTAEKSRMPRKSSSPSRAICFHSTPACPPKETPPPRRGRGKNNKEPRTEDMAVPVTTHSSPE